MMVFLLILLLIPCQANPLEMREAFRKAEKDYEMASKELREVERMISLERSELLRRYNQLRKEVKVLEKRVKNSRKKLEELKTKRADLIEKRLESDVETRELIGEFRIAAKDLKGIILRSPLTAKFPDRYKKVEGFLVKDFLPKLEDIKALTNLYLEDIDYTKEVDLRKSFYIGRGGKRKKGDVLTIGPFTSIYREGGSFGFLGYDPNKRSFFATSPPPFLMRRNIKKYMEGKCEDVFVDISGGASLIQIENRLTFSEQLRRGGPIAIIILFLGIAALIIIVERFLFLRKVDVDATWIIGKLEDLASKGLWDKAVEMVEGSKIPVYEVLYSGLKSRDEDRETLESILQEAILKQLPRLERFLSTLNIIAAIAPLLGLLGTVTGMIKTFHTMTLFGAGNPKLMSGGISEALITTEFGLMVAIPVMFFHSLLSRKVDKIVGDMEEKATSLVNLIFKGEDAR